jgi:hypothetical protein
MDYEIGQQVLVLDTDGVDIWLLGTISSVTHLGKLRVLIDSGGVLDVDPSDPDQIRLPK